VLALIARGPRRRREPKPGERVPGSRLERTLIHLAVFGLILAPLAALLMLFRDQSAAVERTPLRGLPGTGPGGGSGAPVHPAPHVEWTFFLALVVAALVILGFVAVMRRRALAEAEDEEPKDALAPVVAAGIEALESERDPRRAVIKAYAAMERTLAEQELPRKPAETPLEYLRRMLQDLGGRADPARRLTGLFEEAKFSAHVIDEPMRQDALTCLAALRGSAAA